MILSRVGSRDSTLWVEILSRSKYHATGVTFPQLDVVGGTKFDFRVVCTRKLFRLEGIPISFKYP